MADARPGPPADGLSQLLSDEGMEFTPFSRALVGIPWDVASAKPGGSPHSIADILAHMRFWQRRLLDIALTGEARPVPTAKVGWPETGEEEWPELVQGYLSGLEELRELARDDERLRNPAIPGRENSLAYEITSHFAHEAHHVGQIVLLRRQMGAWPPEGGGDTW